ncbi:MAG TPA: glycosyltransferase [Myxococcales bacterium]|jgi:cellulose synthase/poly-beta-1,6-N-acetylglucosamine synthase-like glycosyltransferase
MTLTAWLLFVALLLLALFGAYWGSLQAFALSQAFRPREACPPDRRGRGSVAVLVPSHHEGAALLDTVGTLVDQDYQGPVAVYVLVEGEDDSSVAALRGAYPGRSRQEGGAQVLLDGADRKVCLVATGSRAKHDKLNYALERLAADFYAFLDADHRAAPGWLSSALSALEAAGADAVQCRKMPLSTGRLSQTWDAMLSHGAFELFNRALWRVFGRVFFTGSTALFRARVFRSEPARRFSACITEDTFLSFELLLAGCTIAYDPRIGSFEETTPNLPSFVLRRRRWAAGHTRAFVTHLKGLLTGPLSPRARLQGLFVGPFFLMPAAVVCFFWAQGIYYFVQFTPWVRTGLAGASLALAGLLTVWLSWRRRTKLRDWAVCALFVAPHVGMAGALLYFFFERETYYFLTSFPHQERLWGAQAALLALALGLVAVAWSRLRPTPLRDLLVFLVSWPLCISLDVLGALLGLGDELAGHTEWSKIDRANEYSGASVGALLRGGLAATALRPRGQPAWGLLLPVVLLASAALANEVFSVGPCDEERPLLWRPLSGRWARRPLLSVEVEKSAASGQAAFEVTARLRPGEERALSLRAFLDDVPLAPDAGPLALEQRFRFTRPLGWEEHRLKVSLSGEGVQCVVDRALSTSVVALGKDGGLRVNGEPFLIKGMVPTFSTPAIRLPLADGYREIKRLGVNTLRLYHPPTPAILAAAKARQLLLMAQPEQSTWDAIDPRSAVDRFFYQRRWEELAERLDGFPYALLLVAGNELEIDDRRPEMVRSIASLVEQSRQTRRQVPMSYSTFATFLAYPADVLGINMLDTGETYWRDTLEMLSRAGRPFFASELGGFVAFYESPPAELRRFRLLSQWRRLQEAGGLGAVFYASHDNWAQAVPPGQFNDPLTAEMPDDRRGFFDHLNRPKPELSTLREMLADVELEALDPRVGALDELLRVRLRNRRPYALRGLVASLAGLPWELGDLEPRAEREVALPLLSLRHADGYPLVDLPLAYTTHAGLEAESVARLAVPDPSDGPVVLTPGFEVTARARDALAGSLLDGESLEAVVPDGWRAASVNGLPVAASGRLRVPASAPLHPLLDLEASTDGRTWGPFAFEGSEPEGLVFLRFRLPPGLGSPRLLMLQGVGANQIQVRWSDGETAAYPAHPYRETLVDLEGRAGEVTVRLQRRSLQYLRQSESPTGEAIRIRLAPPVVFSPQAVLVRESP